MMEINSDITRNRAEEYGFDLTNEFVIPPYYDSLQLLKSEKPQIIEGGRGSGKACRLRVFQQGGVCEARIHQSEYK